MRKQPLLALSAFAVALGAVGTLGTSATAGASTGGFHVATTSAHASVAVQAAHRTTKTRRSYRARHSPLVHARSLVVVHDVRRPQNLKLSPITGLPFVHKKHKRKPPVVVAAPPPTTVPPTTVPPTTVPPTTVPPTTVPPTTVPATTGGAGGVWYQLRMCESGGDYSINTGNGFYGAYQFALSTWLGLGFTGLPSNAPPAVQDRAAQELQARSGWGQWPACSAKLGL